MKRGCLLLVLILSTFIGSASLTFRSIGTPVIGSTIITLTLYPIADAYVNSASPNTNYGGEKNLYVSSNSEFNYTYVMFDLSSIPSDANIISANLSLYLAGTGGSIYGWPADRIGVYYCSDSSWTESKITWNDRPSFDPTPTDTWSFSMIYSVRVYKSWNVTKDVRAAFPSGKLTEVVKFEAKTKYGYAVFSSREGSDKPQLRVKFLSSSIAGDSFLLYVFAGVGTVIGIVLIIAIILLKRR